MNGDKRKEKIEKYVNMDLLWYVTIAEELAQRQDLNVLVRQPDHIERVMKKVATKFEELTIAPNFLDEALPTLI